jgi:uncharacterized cupredoxin-like copper-binding protein
VRCARPSCPLLSPVAVVAALSALTLALALAGCGGGGASSEASAPGPAGAETSTGATTNETEATTTETGATTNETEATTNETGATTTETEAAAPKPSATTVTIVVRDGRVTGGIARPSVKKGEQVVLVVRSDVPDHVHLHGYDKMADVAPGKVAKLPFEATIPGRFEVELEDRGLQIAEIEVRP